MEQLDTMNLATLKEKLAHGKYVLFFTAGWCPDCVFIKPALPEIEKDFPEYTFITVDRDQNLELAKEMMIMGIPSFVVVDDGKEIGRFVNKERKTKKQVETFLQSLA